LDFRTAHACYLAGVLLGWGGVLAFQHFSSIYFDWAAVVLVTLAGLAWGNLTFDYGLRARERWYMGQPCRLSAFGAVLAGAIFPPVTLIPCLGTQFGLNNDMLFIVTGMIFLVVPYQSARFAIRPRT